MFIRLLVFVLLFAGLTHCQHTKQEPSQTNPYENEAEVSSKLHIAKTIDIGTKTDRSVKAQDFVGDWQLEDDECAQAPKISFKKRGAQLILSFKRFERDSRMSEIIIPTNGAGFESKNSFQRFSKESKRTVQHDIRSAAQLVANRINIASMIRAYSPVSANVAKNNVSSLSGIYELDRGKQIIVWSRAWTTPISNHNDGPGVYLTTIRCRYKRAEPI